jgi:hypothetical protein
LLGASYGVTTYLNPSFRSAESGYLVISNQLVECVAGDISDFATCEYYLYPHSDLLPVAGTLALPVYWKDGNEKAPVFLQRLHSFSPVVNKLDELKTATFFAV